MAAKEISDFFESAYERELNLRHLLERVDGPLIGIAGALLGVGGVFQQTLFSPMDYSFSAEAFRWLASLYCGTLTSAMFFLGRSIWPREVSLIQSPQQWLDHVTMLEAYHEATKQACEHADVVKMRLEADLAKQATERYVQASEINRRSMLQKSECQAWTKRCLIGSIWILLVGSIPYAIVVRSQNEPRQRIELVSTEQANDSAEFLSGSEASSASERDIP